jgi:hypothetical protein
MLVRRGGSGPAAPRNGHFRNVTCRRSKNGLHLEPALRPFPKSCLNLSRADYCPIIGFSFVNINGTLPAAG